jgi:hypothetical protein
VPVEVASGGVVVAGRSASSSAWRRAARAREVREGEGRRKREKGKRGKEKQGEKEGRGGASVEFAATVASVGLSMRHGTWVEEQRKDGG